MLSFSPKIEKVHNAPSLHAAVILWTTQSVGLFLRLDSKLSLTVFSMHQNFVCPKTPKKLNGDNFVENLTVSFLQNDLQIFIAQFFNRWTSFGRVFHDNNLSLFLSTSIVVSENCKNCCLLWSFSIIKFLFVLDILLQFCHHFTNQPFFNGRRNS